MKERGLIFSGLMVRANLDGRKGQTRRMRGLNKVNENPNKWYLESFDKETGWAIFRTDRRHGHGLRHVVKCPYGVPGDRLYVREAWWDLGHCEDGKWQGRIKSHVLGPRYVADCPDPYAKGIGGIVQPLKQKWQDSQVYRSTWRKRPSIHMPKWAARPERYEITDIRVERAQGISTEDCKAEGVIIRNIGETYWRAFHTLWNSINAKRGYGWQMNPWVWVVCYRKLK